LAIVARLALIVIISLTTAKDCDDLFAVGRVDILAESVKVADFVQSKSPAECREVSSDTCFAVTPAFGYRQAVDEVYLSLGRMSCILRLTICQKRYFALEVKDK